MSDPRLYRFDDLLIDLGGERVERDGLALDVAGLSVRLFEFLIGQGDRVRASPGLARHVYHVSSSMRGLQAR